MNNTFLKTTARILIVSVTFACWPAAQASAEMVPTAHIATQQDQSDRARIDALLARDDVRSALEARGVNYEQAKTRVASLSDEEAATLADKLDSLPAGGDGFFGAVAFIFIVLLITDILGLTKVFSFTRSVK